VAEPTVLLTGATGFVGRQVAAALQRRGSACVALVHQRPAPAELAQARLVHGDYLDDETTARLLAEVSPDIVVHAGWRLAPGAAYLDDAGNIDQLAGALRLFDHALRAGCRRFVGLGTCLEYAGRNGPAAEDAPLDPQTPYAAAKAGLWLAGSLWARARGASFAWARLYHPFGPGEPRHRLVPAVITALLRGERVATTAGDQLRSFLGVEDVGDAIAALALAEVDGAVNIGSADATAVRELVHRIADRLGRADLLDVGALPHRPGDPEVLWPDTTRLNDEVGWQPRLSLDDAVAQAIAWWRAELEAGVV